MVNTPALLLVLLYTSTTTLGYVLTTQDCKACDTVVCPSSDAECPSLSRVSDPCDCCNEGVCPAMETEPCGTARPCERGYFCHKDEGNEEGLCRCRRDKRTVCGTDNTTYRSICELERQTHKPHLLKWGQCDKAPEVVSASGDTAVILGQPVALDCEVKGSPIPTVTWHFISKNGGTKVLPSDDQVTAVLIRGGPEHMMVTSWMQIVETRTSDQGVYSCIATNEHGTAKHQALVNVIEKS